MQWAEQVQHYLQTIKPVTANPALAQKVLGLLDYTSLNETDTEASIATFLTKAQLPAGPVAAVCLYPAFVPLAATQFADTPVKVATVANFPDGTAALDTVLVEIDRALQAGAQEIDVVFPYLRYLAGERQYAHTFVSTCKAVCGDRLLKVILETGALQDPLIIADASYDALAVGADFIKTSTGKIATGATLEAAIVMLLVIHHMQTQLKRSFGLKISGGLKTLAQTAEYLALADTIMGRDWVSPETFRVGSSRLLDEISQLLP